MKSYEAIKIRDEDRAVAMEIARYSGLPLIHSIGAALDAWKKAPRKVREDVIRTRRALRLETDRRMTRQRATA